MTEKGGLPTIPPPFGAIAQLGERLRGTQEVGGSIPPGSTTICENTGTPFGLYVPTCRPTADALSVPDCAPHLWRQRVTLQQRINFTNKEGLSLAAALVMPRDTPPVAYALFAHCFTCGKNNAAAARISRALASRGIAVLRFDFTGLGSSEGDFGNAGFSSNLTDLVAAADFMRAEYSAPMLMIGHSLGGTAVLAAAEQVPECRALVTIGSPAVPEHVLKTIQQRGPEAGGSIPVAIGGREFSVSNSFLADFKQDVVSERLAKLKRALLVFHAPFDNVVPIDEAGRIFQQARHPKSFVSLDGADHLLTNARDSRYVADTIATWVWRYVPDSVDSDQPAVPGGHVVVGELNKKFLRRVSSDTHSWLADEPTSMGGEDLGPDPYEHLLAALGTCTSMTIRMYANRKKWPVDNINVELSHRRTHVQDCEDCDGDGSKVDLIERSVTITGDLTQEQHNRLQQIADRCPVHKTLTGDIRIQAKS